MPRGGHREKAGRKSTWKSGCRYEDTKLIRVPTSISDELLKIAHKLDAGESLDSETKQLSLPIGQATKIDTDTRLTGTKLALRLGISSGAITNWVRDDALSQKTKVHDPDGIAWEREGRKYKPIM